MSPARWYVMQKDLGDVLNHGLSGIRWRKTRGDHRLHKISTVQLITTTDWWLVVIVDLERGQMLRASQILNVQCTSGTNEETLQNIQQNCHQDNRSCYQIKMLLSSMIRGKERIYSVLWEEPRNGPKMTCDLGSMIPEVVKWEYCMNTTLRGTYQKAPWKRNWKYVENGVYKTYT